DLPHPEQRLKRPDDEPVMQVRDESAPARPLLDVNHALLFERAQGLAHGSAARGELLGHVALVRETIPGPELSGKDRAPQLAQDFVGDSHALHWFEHCRSPQTDSIRAAPRAA